jgi:hypothetical protein
LRIESHGKKGRRPRLLKIEEALVLTWGNLAGRKSSFFEKAAFPARLFFGEF